MTPKQKRAKQKRSRLTRAWQFRRKRNGLCTRCGKARDGRSQWLCNRCTMLNRLHMRAYTRCDPQKRGGQGRPPINRSP